MEAEPTVFCYECKHLVGRRNNLEAAQSWKCAAPQNIERIEKDPVTAMSIYIYRHPSCYAARGLGEVGQPSTWEVCGPVGQWYEKYEPYQEPRGSNPLAPRKPQAPSADDLLKELEP